LATIIKNAGSGWQQQKTNKLKKNTGGEIVDIDQHYVYLIISYL